MYGHYIQDFSRIFAARFASAVTFSTSATLTRSHMLSRDLRTAEQHPTADDRTTPVSHFWAPASQFCVQSPLPSHPNL